MKTFNKFVCAAFCSFVLFACADSNNEAKNYLQSINTLYEQGDYDLAKQKIDSIQILYPKSFDQIKEGLALLQKVRKSQDSLQVIYCDSALTALDLKIDSIKRFFTFEQNKTYEDNGRFVPKGTPTTLTGANLRSGVNQDGTMYIESVYIGGQLHNQVKVSTKNDTYAETLPVMDDGLNFRFTDMGKQYEIMKFGKQDDNSVAKFIYANANQPLTVTLKGKNTTSYQLSKQSKTGIANSFLLSSFILQADSLKDIKIVAAKRLEYVTGKINAANK